MLSYEIPEGLFHCGAEEGLSRCVREAVVTGYDDVTRSMVRRRSRCVHPDGGHRDGQFHGEIRGVLEVGALDRWAPVVRVAVTDVAEDGGTTQDAQDCHRKETDGRGNARRQRR